MNSIRAVMACILIGSGALRAQSRAMSQDTTAARRAIIALEERIGTANLTCDYAFFRAIEAPEFTFTDARGTVTTRAEDLAGESSCKPHKGSYVLDELRLQYHGDVVVFNARATTTVQRDTLPPSVVRTRFTAVLVRRDTTWVLVSGHSSRIPLPATAQAQSALRFTLPYGRFAVGFKSVDQYDSSRSFGGDVDPDGRPRTGERARPIQTSVWYPAASNAGRPMTYGDYLGLIAAPGALPSLDSATRASAARALAHRFSPNDDARSTREMSAPTHAVRDAAPSGERFPVIVYSASLAAPSFENAKLMEYLASFGYIVVASPSYGPQGPQTSDAPGLEAQARDMEFLIGYARSIPGADIDRLAVMGFSWGGLASVLTTMRTPSVKALVSLDGSIAYFYHRQFEHNPDMNIARFTVPSLFLKQHTPSAEMKKSLGPDSVFDFFKDIKYSDATLVTFNTLAHQNFGEWFDRLQYAPGPAFVADTLVQSVGYEHVALYVRHFLDATLKHDAEGQAFLGRSPAENGILAAELTVEHHPALRPLVKRFER